MNVKKLTNFLATAKNKIVSSVSPSAKENERKANIEDEKLLLSLNGLANLNFHMEDKFVKKYVARIKSEMQSEIVSNISQEDYDFFAKMKITNTELMEKILKAGSKEDALLLYKAGIPPGFIFDILKTNRISDALILAKNDISVGHIASILKADKFEEAMILRQNKIPVGYPILRLIYRGFDVNKIVDLYCGGIVETFEIEKLLNLNCTAKDALRLHKAGFNANNIGKIAINKYCLNGSIGVDVDVETAQEKFDNALKLSRRKFYKDDITYIVNDSDKLQKAFRLSDMGISPELISETIFIKNLSDDELERIIEKSAWDCIDFIKSFKEKDIKSEQKYFGFNQNKNTDLWKKITLTVLIPVYRQGTLKICWINQQV